MTTYAAPRRRRLGAQRRQALDRAGLDRRRRGHLGQDRRRASAASSCPPTPRASPPPRSSRSCPCAPPSSATSRCTTCGCPPTRCCPNVVGLKGPFSCLNEARYGIIWGAMGAARDSYEAALATRRTGSSSTSRWPVTSSPSRSWSTWRWRSRRASCSPCRPGRLKDAGTLQPEQISFGKLNNVPRGHRDLPRGPHHPRRQRHHPGLLAAAARQQPGIGAHLRGHRRGAHPDHGPGHHRPPRLPLSRP